MFTGPREKAKRQVSVVMSVPFVVNASGGSFSCYYIYLSSGSGLTSTRCPGCGDQISPEQVRDSCE